MKKIIFIFILKILILLNVFTENNILYPNSIKLFRAFNGAIYRLDLEINNNKMKFVYGYDAPYDNIFEFNYSINNNIISLIPIKHYEIIYSPDNNHKVKNLNIKKEDTVLIKLMSKTDNNLILQFTKTNNYFNSIFKDVIDDYFGDKNDIYFINLKNNLLEFKTRPKQYK